MLHLIAFRNVKVHWRQSLAALLSISVAFYAFVLFQGYIQDVGRNYLEGYRNRSMFGDLIIENKDRTSPAAQRDVWKYLMTKEEQESIEEALQKRSSQIFGQVRFIEFQGLVATGIASKIFLAHGMDVDQGAKVRENWNWNATYGEPLHVTKISNPVLLSEGLARQLGCEPDQKLYTLKPSGGYPAEVRPFHCRHPDVQFSVTTENANLNAMDFQVSGLMDAGYKDIDQMFLEMPLPLALKLLNTDKITLWSVKLNPGVEKNHFIQDLNQELQARHPELRAVDWIDHPLGDLYLKTMSLLGIFRNFVTIVVAFISVVSVMNTMIKIVKERTREIGTLLSLGFQRSQVLGIFLLEALFLGVLGCCVGALMSLAMTLILNHAGITYKAGLLSQPIHFQIMVVPRLYLSATALLLMVTVVTSYLTCRSSVRKKIVECLASV